MIEQGSNTYFTSPPTVLSYDSRKVDGSLPVVRLGKYCSIGENCTFVLSNHVTDRFTTFPTACLGAPPLFSVGNASSFSRGDILIGSDVWIGANCTVMDNITIGDGAVVGAGSVVTKSVPPYSIVGGAPARHIRFRFTEPLVAEIVALRFWELPDALILTFNPWTSDIPQLIEAVKAHRLADQHAFALPQPG